jgi:hypothetical protein
MLRRCHEGFEQEMTGSANKCADQASGKITGIAKVLSIDCVGALGDM